MIIVKIMPKLGRAQHGKAEKKARKSKAVSIRDLTNYIRAGEQNEKLLYLTTRGFITDDWVAQQAEMIALASESVRSFMPVTHWVLSWREGEQPTTYQIEEAVDIFLRELGLEGHQAVAGVHQDTDNAHLHIAVNRVHPDLGKAIKPCRGFDIEAGHRAIGRIEQVQGWQPEPNGRYVSDCAGGVIRAKREHDRNLAPTSPACDLEGWTGKKSVMRIVQEEAAAIIAGASSWCELHRNLAERGMRYEAKGMGAVIFIGDVGVKASRTKDPQCTLSALQNRLGKFEWRDPCQIVTERTAEPLIEADSWWRARWLEYNAARMADREARAAARRARIAQHAFAKTTLLSVHRDLRLRCMAGSWQGRGVARSAIASVLAEERARALALLREVQRYERGVRRKPSFPSFEAWLTIIDSADAARAWRFRASGEYARISGDRFLLPRPYELSDMVATEEGRAVRYTSTTGETAFIDRGRELAMIRLDRHSTQAALELASAKWGRAHVWGGERFRRMCVELAAKNNFRLMNEQPQAQVAASRIATREQGIASEAADPTAS